MHSDRADVGPQEVPLSTQTPINRPGHERSARSPSRKEPEEPDRLTPFNPDFDDGNDPLGGDDEFDGFDVEEEAAEPEAKHWFDPIKSIHDILVEAGGAIVAIIFGLTIGAGTAVIATAPPQPHTLCEYIDLGTSLVMVAFS